MNKSKVLCKSSGSDKIFAVSPSCSTSTIEIETPSDITYKKQGVTEKIRVLVSEFKSLTEPIDRVKRLHYAEMLSPFDESGRVPANRVKGCTTQVWTKTGR